MYACVCVCARVCECTYHPIRAHIYNKRLAGVAHTLVLLLLWYYQLLIANFQTEIGLSCLKDFRMEGGREVLSRFLSKKMYIFSNDVTLLYNV